MKSTIELLLNIDTAHSKYDFFAFDESNYPSKEEYLSWCNYITQKRASTDDLLTDLVTSASTAAFDAIRQTFFKKRDKITKSEVDRLVKEWVKSNPNMTWED